MVELVKENWINAVNPLVIGAAKDEGGTRQKIVKCGQEKTLPFLFEEGPMPNPPVIALEILDIAPDDWPEDLIKNYGSVINSPIDWAQKGENEIRADLILLRLAGAHPDTKNKSIDELSRLIKDILKAVSIPVIVVGCQDNKRDNEILPYISQAAKGERLLFGEAAQENYKTLTASVMADGHSIIAQSPIDINIAKQLNILITDCGLSPERIAINPTVGALGYGLEYAYSIMERARLASLSGDKMLAMPFICFVGNEAWRTKEARASQEEFPSWGSNIERGIIWETLTAEAFLQSGADILVMRHPQSIKLIKERITELMTQV